MYKKLFPQLASATWRYFNLDYLASLFFPLDRYPQNPLLNSAFCENWLKEMNALWQCNYSWGGYLEDRAFLWRDSYLTRGHEPNLHDSNAGLKTIHLGVDFNVPAGTLVHSPFAGRVINVTADKDTDGGWGGRVTVEWIKKTDHVVTLVYGHLSHESLPRVNKKLAFGDVIGAVGDFPENGNWFPHLHVQQLNLYSDQNRRKAFAALDGYTYRSIDPRLVSPDPSWLLI